METWNEFVETIFQIPNRKSRDLSSFAQLDLSIGSPHQAFQTIHVGGTNGKGSVTWKIAKALEREGFKVGLFTSPHIIDVRERIQVNSEMISENDFRRIVEPLLKNNEGLSFFDIITAAAFIYFKEKQVDWAVIEVGLGGRFDSTNVIVPKVSVITSISYDHTQLLGDSLEQIAWEKGGIQKDGVPLVTGPTAAPFFPDSIQVDGKLFYDLENQSIARTVLELLHISESSIAFGIQSRPPCRFQVVPKALSGKVNLILDVAHNPGGFERLVDALQLYFPPEMKFHFIVAFSKDKDWRRCIDIILPVAETITAVSCDKSRVENPKIVQQYHPNIETANSIKSALFTNGWNVICGSFYLMKDAIQIKDGES